MKTNKFAAFKKALKKDITSPKDLQNLLNSIPLDFELPKQIFPDKVEVGFTDEIVSVEYKTFNECKELDDPGFTILVINTKSGLTISFDDFRASSKSTINGELVRTKFLSEILEMKMEGKILTVINKEIDHALTRVYDHRTIRKHSYKITIN